MIGTVCISPQSVSGGIQEQQSCEEEFKALPKAQQTRCGRNWWSLMSF